MLGTIEDSTTRGKRSRAMLPGGGDSLWRSPTVRVSVPLGQSDAQSEPVPGAGNRADTAKGTTQNHLRNRRSQVRIQSGALSNGGRSRSTVRSPAAPSKSAPFDRNRRSCPQAEWDYRSNRPVGFSESRRTPRVRTERSRIRKSLRFEAGPRYVPRDHRQALSRQRVFGVNGPGEGAWEPAIGGHRVRTV